MMTKKFIYLSWTIFFVLTLSCGAEDDTPTTTPNTPEENVIPLPEVNAEAFQIFEQGQTPTAFGFYLYVPPGFDSSSSTSYPLLVYLHGGGARGDGSSEMMRKVLFDGVPRLIGADQWDPTHPMIVVAPQSPTLWDANHLHDLIAYLMDTYPVQDSRIYMTGLSMGGRGCFDYVSTKGTDAYTAAIVPIAGWGDETTGNQFQTVPVWAFHGSADSVVSVSNSITMIGAINAANPEVSAKLTLYEGVDHNSWTRTYTSEGMGTESTMYDPFEISIYDWMYSFERIVN